MTKEDIIIEGDALEELTHHRAWPLFVKKLTDRANAVTKKNEGIVHDLNQINFDNGLRRGLVKEPLSIIQKAINLKNDELKKIEDSSGETNA